MKKSFEVGERVAFYERAVRDIAIVKSIDGDGSLNVEIDGQDFWVHPKQCK